MTEPNQVNHLNSDLLAKLRKPTEPVDKTKFKKEALDNHRKHLENSSLEQEIKLKQTICTWVVKTVSRYLITVFALIFTVTITFPIFHITANLSDKVLITLLTTTTISLVGLPTLIIKSLFPSKNNSS